MYVIDLTHYLDSKGAVAPERAAPPERWLTS